MSISFSLSQHERGLNAESRYWACNEVVRSVLQVSVGEPWKLSEWLIQTDEHTFNALLADQFMDYQDCFDLCCAHEALQWVFAAFRADRDSGTYLQTLRAARKGYVESLKVVQW